MSDAASTFLPGLENVLIGGDAFASYIYPLTYPLSLTATNLYWNYLSPIYSLNLAPGAVANGGMIILYGGSDDTNSTSTVIGYSPSGDTSLALAPMSMPRSHLGYAPDASGSPYAIGGLDANGQPLASAERYDVDTDTWAPIRSLPAPRADFPAVFNRANMICVFGGSTNAAPGSETSSALRYSVAANAWTAIAPMPVAVSGSAAALGPDGKFYVAGGISNGVTLDLVQVYDPADNSWTVSTPLPVAVSAAAMGVDSLGRLILMGGRDSTVSDVANVWRSQQLAAPDVAPVLTQYPATSAVYQVAYVSSINATGNPPPTYSLVTGPAGMQVDAFSGSISWTPQVDQIGTNAVTIRAENYAGSVDWSFAITVPNPPPTNPTGLAVVSVTDNSVTLSWSPADPAAGAVTYGAYLRHVLHDPKGSGATIWYTQIGSSVTQPSMTIAGLTPGSSQVYYIRATGPGGSSAYGSGILATTTAPQGPPRLAVSGLTSTTISLAWDPSAGPADNPLYSPVVSYTIMERKTSVSPPVNVPTVANLTTTSGTVTGLTPGSSHLWFVSGVDAAGNASPLGTVYVSVVNPIPTPAHLSTGTRILNGSFQFTVQEGGATVQTAVIEANSNLANPNGWVQIDSLLPASGTFTFTDTNASAFSARYYRVLTP